MLLARIPGSLQKIQSFRLLNFRPSCRTSWKSSVMQSCSWLAPISAAQSYSRSARPLCLQPFVRLCDVLVSVRARKNCATALESTAQIARQTSRPVSAGATTTEQPAVAEHPLSLSVLSSRTAMAEAKVGQVVQVRRSAAWPSHSLL